MESPNTAAATQTVRQLFIFSKSQMKNVKYILVKDKYVSLYDIGELLLSIKI